MKTSWRTRRCLTVLFCLVGTTLLFCGCQSSRAYPNRPIMLICPWSAGGGTDRVARQVAALLEQEIGVPVNVVNATGGGGVTGHTRGALARPDGYTLTMVTVEINMLHWRGLTSISHEDFAPVGLVNFDAAAIFVRGDAPWRDLDQFAEYARTETAKLKASGTANGGIWHLAFAGFLDQIGVNPSDATWIPNNGAAPSLQELLAGGIDAVCCSLPEAQSILEAGDVRCLGVMADERVGQYPDVPTLKEQGVDWTMTAWRGVCVPVDTPPEIRAYLVGALEKVALGDTFKTYMRNSGFNATWEPDEQFRDHMRDVDARLGKLLTGDALSIQAIWFGPMFFPGVLGVLLVVVVAALLVTGGLRKAEGVEPVTPQGWATALGLLLWVVIYVVFAEWAGFIIVAGVLLTLLLWRMGNRLPLSLAVSIVVVPLAYQLFAVLLRVPLPRGWLGW